MKKAILPRHIADGVGLCLREGDLEGLVRFFHPDCLIAYPENEPPKRGHEGVRELFAPFMPLRPILVSEVTGEMIHGDTALITGKWHLEDGQGNILDSGESTEVAKKNEEGGWVYFLDCPFGPPGIGAA